MDGTAESDPRQDQRGTDRGRNVDRDKHSPMEKLAPSAVFAGWGAEEREVDGEASGGSHSTRWSQSEQCASAA